VNTLGNRMYKVDKQKNTNNGKKHTQTRCQFGKAVGMGTGDGDRQDQGVNDGTRTETQNQLMVLFSK